MIETLCIKIAVLFYTAMLNDEIMAININKKGSDVEISPYLIFYWLCHACQLGMAHLFFCDRNEE